MPPKPAWFPMTQQHWRLRQLVESPALRTSLGRAARQRYEQHYTAQRMGMG